MTYVITRSCINDTSCVSVCPVNSIHPTADEPGYTNAEMLYIDPNVCIECGACMDACPVSAIFPSYELPDTLEEYEGINALYYEDPENADYEQVANEPETREFTGEFTSDLNVAIIGSGPSACYAAEELANTRGLNVKVDMFERLPVPFGLVRYGVAPDHQDTKTITTHFSSLFRRKNVRLFLNTEVGRDITHQQLLERYQAVIYASGASKDKRLNIPGEDLPGSHSATDFVGWYNGHPDHTDHDFDLNTERVVVLGNGNVALDVARILGERNTVRDTSDIADYALEKLNDSPVSEIVIAGRRGPADAAFTTPELLGLLATQGIHVRIAGADPADEEPRHHMNALKLETLSTLGTDLAPIEDAKTVTLRFLSTPIEIVGEDRVTGIRVAKNTIEERGGRLVAQPTDETELLEAGLVIRSVGFHGKPIEGLPFDESRGVVPNTNGRVETDEPVYVTGWIKRGPSGVIGTNRRCARETVDSLFEDIESGRIPDAAPSASEDIAELLPHALDAKAWKKLDRHERAAGRPDGRPRKKLTEISAMIEVASSNG